MADLRKLFNQEEYSDITVKCGNVVIKAHKLIPCQIEYFEKLCGKSSRFKEAEQKTIELFDDDPEAVRAMLQYLYRVGYSMHLWRQGDEENARFFAQAFAVASKYGYKDFEDHVCGTFDRFLSSHGCPKFRKGLEEQLAAIGVMYEILPDPPEDLAERLHRYCREELDFYLKDPESAAKLRCLVNTHDEFADHLAYALAKRDQLQAFQAQHCSRCGSQLSSRQVACDSGEPECADAAVVAKRCYRLKDASAEEAQ